MTATAVHADEMAFQAALDADPGDHTTRLVFADWLEERGDPRAEGYRALGVWRRVPHREFTQSAGLCWYYPGCGYDWSGVPPAGTPRTWLPKSLKAAHWQTLPTRRAAEDAAALAFARLPPARRAELLGRS